MAYARKRSGYKGRYVSLYVPGRGWIYEHRFVMEQALGRRLESHEQVHHRNGNKTDNRLENLELHSSASSHGRRHRAADRTAIVRLYKEGLGMVSIAERLGVGDGTVFAAIHEAGLGRSRSEAARIRPRNADGKFTARP